MLLVQEQRTVSVIRDVNPPVHRIFLRIQDYICYQLKINEKWKFKISPNDHILIHPLHFWSKWMVETKPLISSLNVSSHFYFFENSEEKNFLPFHSLHSSTLLLKFLFSSQKVLSKENFQKPKYQCKILRWKHLKVQVLK